MTAVIGAWWAMTLSIVWRTPAMPMIDVYAPAGTFADPHGLATSAAATVKEVEGVPDIPMFRENTAAFVHELPAPAISDVDGRSDHVRVQVLTNAGGLDRDKQLARGRAADVRWSRRLAGDSPRSRGGHGALTRARAGRLGPVGPCPDPTRSWVAAARAEIARAPTALIQALRRGNP
jgi:hypothetical protein